MAKADRLERADGRRIELEAEYSAVLIAALQKTADGMWGLFDHQVDRHARARVAPVIASLSELGEAIDGLREQLGMAPFELHQTFRTSRGPVASNAVGEPKQARAWLERLGVPVDG